MQELKEYLKTETAAFCWFKQFRNNEFTIISNTYGDSYPFVFKDIAFYVDDKTHALVQYLVIKFFEGSDNEKNA